MAVVAVLLIHMDRKDETIMKPNINLCERVVKNGEGRLRCAEKCT